MTQEDFFTLGAWDGAYSLYEGGPQNRPGSESSISLDGCDESLLYNTPQNASLDETNTSEHGLPRQPGSRRPSSPTLGCWEHIITTIPRPATPPSKPMNRFLSEKETGIQALAANPYLGLRERAEPQALNRDTAIDGTNGNSHGHPLFVYQGWSVHDPMTWTAHSGTATNALSAPKRIDTCDFYLYPPSKDGKLAPEEPLQASARPVEDRGMQHEKKVGEGLSGVCEDMRNKWQGPRCLRDSHQEKCGTLAYKSM